jgi:hypothetical protein
MHTGRQMDEAPSIFSRHLPNRKKEESRFDGRVVPEIEVTQKYRP